MDKKKEEQHKDERKKNKSKFVPIPARGVPTTPLIIVSALATRRMDKGDYVPLWYFTNSGLDDTAKAFSILKEDALSLIKRDDGSTSLVLCFCPRNLEALLRTVNCPGTISV